MVFDPNFDNRSQEGLDLKVDGHDVEWDREESFTEYNSTYTTSEALETEPQLADEQ